MEGEESYADTVPSRVSGGIEPGWYTAEVKTPVRAAVGERQPRWRTRTTSAGDLFHAFLERSGPPAVRLCQHDTELSRTSHLIAMPYVCVAAVTERFAPFCVLEFWNGWPTQLQVTAKATFMRWRSRRLVVTRTNPA
jgi:hypothetical protein